jgi:hypothetical protein
VRKSIVGAMALLIASLGPGPVNAKLPSMVPLNHFYLILDSATYKAIEQSSFLRKEFATTEQRTTTRTDTSYTGLYFYGANTYFEFFDAANQAIGKLSDSGLALGTDRAGTLEAVKTDLAGAFSVGAPITRGFNGKQVPWFYMAVPRNFPESSGLRVWVMEYHPRFLAEWNSQSDNENQGITRKQILARYAAVLPNTPRTPYLKDVVALTIAVDEVTAKKLIELCQLLGYRRRVKGVTTILQGEDVELHLVPQTDSARGIQEITMRVDRTPEYQREFRFGARSFLKFRGNGVATWSF